MKKNNVYICRIRDGAKPLLEDLLILTGTFEFKNEISQDLVKKKCCQRAYLTWCISCGRFGKQSETSSYHLEIFSIYKEHSEALVELMNKFHLNAKSIERKKGYITYLKEAEKIADFLKHRRCARRAYEI